MDVSVRARSRACVRVYPQGCIMYTCAARVGRESKNNVYCILCLREAMMTILHTVRDILRSVFDRHRMDHGRPQRSHGGGGFYQHHVNGSARPRDADGGADKPFF